MATIDVYNQSREKVSQIELSETVFGAEVKEYLFWEVVRNQLASRRGGNHKTKTRTEVRGGGRKPFRQKGTGRARQGSSRSPIMVGGGVAHGPRPRDYSYTVPKKVRRQALRCALSLRAQENKITVIEDLEMSEIKTKSMNELFKRFELNKALLVDVENDNLRMSVRNMEHFQVLPPIGVNVYDLLRYENLVLTRRAVEALEARLG